MSALVSAHARGCPPSAQNEAAVDRQRLAGERCGVVADQHGHHSSGVIRGERSRQRLVGLGIDELGRRDLGGGGSVRQPRRYRGDCNPVASKPDLNVRAMPISAPFDAM